MTKKVRILTKKQPKSEQAKSEWAKSEQAKSEQAKTEQAKTEQAKSEQLKFPQTTVSSMELFFSGQLTTSWKNWATLRKKSVWHPPNITMPWKSWTALRKKLFWPPSRYHGNWMLEFLDLERKTIQLNARHNARGILVGFGEQFLLLGDARWDCCAEKYHHKNDLTPLCQLMIDTHPSRFVFVSQSSCFTQSHNTEY